MSDSTDTKKRHICPHCDQGCSTSSHLARHLRIHSGVKEYRCDYPGCEKRSSRLDNLRAHRRVHSAEPRPKASRKLKGSANPSPTSSTSSSPDIPYQPPPPQLSHTLAPHGSDGSTSNSLRLFMPAPAPPPQDPFVEDSFNNLSPPPSLHSQAHLYPRPHRGLPPPFMGVRPADSFNYMPPERRSNSDLYQPTASSSRSASAARAPYPYATYPPDPPDSQFTAAQGPWYNWNFPSQNNM